MVPDSFAFDDSVLECAARTQTMKAIGFSRKQATYDPIMTAERSVLPISRRIALYCGTFLLN